MKEIGEILRTRREELELSIDEISVKTKLSPTYIKAIEEGNIAFFKEDLSYLTYFVRYYANALNLSYNDLRDDLEDNIAEYTGAISRTQIERQEELSSSIKQKTENYKQSKQLTSRKLSKPSYHKTDIPTLLLLSLAVLIVVGLAVLGVKYVLNHNEDPIPEVIQKPESPQEEVAPEPEIPVVESKLNIVALDVQSYEIRNWSSDEIVEFEVQFNNRSWTGFREDNKTLLNPAEKIYESGTVAKASISPNNGKTFTINFGYLNGNVITVNGEEIVIDKSIANTDVAKLTFKFVEGE